MLNYLDPKRVSLTVGLLGCLPSTDPSDPSPPTADSPPSSPDTEAVVDGDFLSSTALLLSDVACVSHEEKTREHMYVSHLHVRVWAHDSVERQVLQRRLRWLQEA